MDPGGCGRWGGWGGWGGWLSSGAVSLTVKWLLCVKETCGRTAGEPGKATAADQGDVSDRFGRILDGGRGDREGIGVIVSGPSTNGTRAWGAEPGRWCGLSSLAPLPARAEAGRIAGWDVDDPVDDMRNLFTTLRYTMAREH